jgi:Ca2+/H+ antiporter
MARGSKTEKKDYVAAPKWKAAHKAEKKRPKYAATLSAITMEILLAGLLVYQVYKILGFSYSLPARALSRLSPSADPLDYLFIILTAALLIALYFTIKKKHPALFTAQKLAGKTIKDEAKSRFLSAKDDPRVAALLLIEIIAVVGIAVSIAAYLDPQWELIPWANYNVYPPLSTIFNAIIFIVIAAFFIVLYNFTKPYRKSR